MHKQATKNETSRINCDFGSACQDSLLDEITCSTVNCSLATHRSSAAGARSARRISSTDVIIIIVSSSSGGGSSSESTESLVVAVDNTMIRRLKRCRPLAGNVTYSGSSSHDWNSTIWVTACEIPKWALACRLSAVMSLINRLVDIYHMPEPPCRQWPQIMAIAFHFAASGNPPFRRTTR